MNGWIGVTSASPQNAWRRANPGLKRLIGGTDTPCVRAAPRATFIQNPSTSLGVTRTMRTGGIRATYADQLLKSSSGSMVRGSLRGARRLLAACSNGGVMKVTSYDDEVSRYAATSGAFFAAAASSASGRYGRSGSIGRGVGPGGGVVVIAAAAVESAAHTSSTRVSRVLALSRPSSSS